MTTEPVWQVEEGLTRAGFVGDVDRLPAGVALALRMDDRAQEREVRAEERRRADAAAERAETRWQLNVMEAQKWATNRGQQFNPMRWQDYYPSIAERCALDDRLEAAAAAREERRLLASVGLLHLLDRPAGPREPAALPPACLE